MILYIIDITLICLTLLLFTKNVINQQNCKFLNENLNLKHNMKKY
jgi:hypothetical protein